MTNTQNPYDVLADKQKEVSIAEKTDTPAPAVSNTPRQEQPPVQNTQAGIPDDQSIFDVIIKVIIDIIARLTKQPSPTGGKLPTLSKAALQKQASATTQKVRGTVTGGLGAVGNKLESVAHTALDSAGSLAQQAKNTTKQTTQQATENNNTTDQQSD